VVYLYAYTNFKDGLDSLRRVASIYWFLEKKGIKAEILLNEYRAQLLAKEWGLPLATTIETIKDIDAVATNSDIILIDSPELIEGKVLNYPNKFKEIIYINSSCKKAEFKGATVLNLFDDGIIFPSLKSSEKLDKTIFIFGDSDYNKTILKISENFKNKKIDLYWGIYFFVKYEDKLLDIFDKIVESEDYYNAINSYKNVITSSIQIAIDAKLNGANVAFLSQLRENSCNLKKLEDYNIKLIDNIELINKINYQKLNNINYTDMNNQIYNIIINNM
jgi:hypothetical protein